MEEPAIQAASEILQIQRETLDPYHANLRQLLLGSTAAGYLVEKQQEVANDRANAKLVEDVIALLPGADPYSGFNPKNVAEAKLIQFHAVKLEGIDDDYCYMIGRRDYRDESQPTAPIIGAELLLQSVRQSRCCYAVKVVSEDLEARDKNASHNLVREYTPEDIDSMFNMQTGTFDLRVSYNDKGTTPSIDRIHRHKRQASRGVMRMLNGNAVTRVWDGISDTMLAEFNVMKYLLELTSAFEVADDVQLLLRNYSSRSGTDQDAQA